MVMLSEVSDDAVVHNKILDVYAYVSEDSNLEKSTLLTEVTTERIKQTSGSSKRCHGQLEHPSFSKRRFSVPPKSPLVSFSALSFPRIDETHTSASLSPPQCDTST